MLYSIERCTKIKIDYFYIKFVDNIFFSKVFFIYKERELVSILISLNLVRSICVKMLLIYLRSWR